MGSKTTDATVTRRHHADEVSCERAIKLLLDYAKLDYAKNNGPPPDKSGPDDATVRNKEGVNYVDQRPD
jgi:hypothetical protein